MPAGDRRERALAVARDVAARVTDPDRLAGAFAGAGWDPSAVAQGESGLAVMCGYLDACMPGEGWDVAGHRLLRVAAVAAERAQLADPGLFGGLGGLAFAACYLSREGARYQRLVTSLEGALVPRVPAMAAEEFDLVSGLSGMGAYLLGRHGQGWDGTLGSVLRRLVELSSSGAGVPRWWTPAHLIADESMAREFPAGCLNCGLAHGIPGPLAVLALALRDGVEVAGQAAALRRLAEWLVEHRVDDAWGVGWPSAVAAGPGDRLPPRPTRSAWCYGSPGVARALWLAGDSLGESALCTLAVEAMEAVYRRPPAERDIDSPTFCHGVAGLLQVTLRFAHDTGLAVFDDAARALVDQLLSCYRPETRFGFASLEPGGVEVDRPGVLDGAAGVAMALLAAAVDVEPSWDRMFLLS